MWDRRGLSEALSELLILAVAIVVLSALAYFWTNLVLPSAKVQLEVKGCAGKIVIYDVAGHLEMGVFVGKLQGWTSNKINSFLNPGDFITLNATPGDYVILIANSKQTLTQATVRVS